MTLTTTEQRRLLVIGQVDRGQLTAGQAAEVLDLSERQVRRIVAAYRKEGAAAIAHGNRGRSPAHRIPEVVRRAVLDLARTRYARVNDQHLSELLAEREGIVLSRATVRRIRQAAGLTSPRTRRAPQHRQRRERRAQAGLLVQWDGSHHAWLEERGPRLVLLAAVDDATGEVLAAHFRQQEDAHGYLQLLHDLVTAHGCPVALYHDRHGIFRLTTPETLAEHLAGQRDLTQVGRTLAELGIQAIVARSPQAKGRIERLFGTFQDRLVVELRLAGAATLAGANAVLAAFLPHFNARFAVPARTPEPAFRPPAATVDLASICCFKYQRTVAADNTVQFGDHRLQLLPGKHRFSYAKAHVEVQERLDGRLVVTYQGEVVASQPAPAEAPLLRARKGRVTQPAVIDRGGDPLREERREDLVVGAGVGMGATPAGVVPMSTPRPPPIDHPWRRAYKPPGDKVTDPLP